MCHSCISTNTKQLFEALRNLDILLWISTYPRTDLGKRGCPLKNDCFIDCALISIQAQTQTTMEQPVGHLENFILCGDTTGDTQNTSQ